MFYSWRGMCSSRKKLACTRLMIRYYAFIHRCGVLPLAFVQWFVNNFTNVVNFTITFNKGKLKEFLYTYIHYFFNFIIDKLNHWNVLRPFSGYYAGNAPTNLFSYTYDIRIVSEPRFICFPEVCISNSVAMPWLCRIHM